MGCKTMSVVCRGVNYSHDTRCGHFLYISAWVSCVCSSISKVVEDLNYGRV